MQPVFQLLWSVNGVFRLKYRIQPGFQLLYKFSGVILHSRAWDPARPPALVESPIGSQDLASARQQDQTLRSARRISVLQLLRGVRSRISRSQMGEIKRLPNW